MARRMGLRQAGAGRAAQGVLSYAHSQLRCFLLLQHKTPLLISWRTMRHSRWSMTTIKKMKSHLVWEEAHGRVCAMV